MVAIFTGILPADDAVETPSHLRVEPQKEREPFYTASNYAYCAYSYDSINTYGTINLCRCGGSLQAPMQMALTLPAANETMHATLEALHPAAAPSLLANKLNPCQSRRHCKQ
jgi:hypothetical protein